MRFIITLLLFLTLSITVVLGQVAVRGLMFNPSGDQGQYFKKKFTAEIMYMDQEFDERFRTRMGIGWVNLKSRLDTFPAYGLKITDTETTLLPGYQIYNKYNIMYLFAGMDWSFVMKEKFITYLGMDVLGGQLVSDEIYNIETFISEESSGGYILGGLRFRLGGMYKISDLIYIFAETNVAGYIIGEHSKQSHYDYGAGIFIDF